MRIRKRKQFLFADNMIMYLENPRETMVKVSPIIKEFSKAAEYKINIRKLKLLVIRYRNNNQFVDIMGEKPHLNSNKGD